MGWFGWLGWFWGRGFVSGGRKREGKREGAWRFFMARKETTIGRGGLKE
jgi:hypothetical protein